MDRKSKIDPVLKVELVEKYLRNEISTSEAARRAGLSGNGTDAFRKWIDIYRNEGSGFPKSNTQTHHVFICDLIVS